MSLDKEKLVSLFEQMAIVFNEIIGNLDGIVDSDAYDSMENELSALEKELDELQN